MSSHLGHSIWIFLDQNLPTIFRSLTEIELFEWRQNIAISLKHGKFWLFPFTECEREKTSNIDTVELSVFVGELESMFVEVRYIVISPAVWL